MRHTSIRKGGNVYEEIQVNKKQFICGETELYFNSQDREYPNYLLDDEGIEKLICRLQKARETKKELLRYVQMIARGEYIDVEKEFI